MNHAMEVCDEWIITIIGSKQQARCQTPMRLYPPDRMVAQSVPPVSLGICGVPFGSHADYTGGHGVFGTC